MKQVSGIHHITAIASDAKRCVDFYARVLGLRLVKKSVNQDQVEAYHLFFGDTTGEPGMDLTFFTFPGLGRGQAGYGAVATISLAVAEDALDFWVDRFEQEGVTHEAGKEKWGKPVVGFEDFDGQQLELVGVGAEELGKLSGEVWETEAVGKAEAIRSFWSAEMLVASKSALEPVLTRVLGFEQVDESEEGGLYELPGKFRGARVEVVEHPGENAVVNAAGTVHHIAFGVADKDELLAGREKVLGLGLFPTGVIDRYYFKSVYFRTPAGILFELATLGPGFGVDEDKDKLGEKLALPPFLEGQRAEIEAGLEPI